jgi:hypothetical protein
MKDALGHGSAAHQSGVEDARSVPRSALVSSASDRDLVDISRGQRQVLLNAALRQKAQQTGK